MRYLFVSYIEDAYPSDMDGVAVATAIVLTCFAPMLRFRLQSLVMDHACYLLPYHDSYLFLVLLGRVFM